MKNHRAVVYAGRKAWQIDSGKVAITLLEGGGHIASLEHADRKGVNPLWIPAWDTIEPWRYRKERDLARFASPLLASIMGHNLCLGHFGDPSPEERKAGLSAHGEAPVKRWKLLNTGQRGKNTRFSYGCDLPVAGIRFQRNVAITDGAEDICITEELENLSRCDKPYTMCQHVTFGPPFLGKGETYFDMSATLGHTFPGKFSRNQRLAQDEPFEWPAGPGRRGKRVDLRQIEKKFRKSGDFTTQLMDRKQSHAWFSAVNPRLGLMAAYVWNRNDFPWIGNWEENHVRDGAPWNGVSLARGMEFSNAPFPLPLRDMVELGSLSGEKTFRWLPARGRNRLRYHILVRAIGNNTGGVRAITPTGEGFDITFR